MRRLGIKSLAAGLVTLLLAAMAAQAEDRPFDPARLSRAEIRFLQTALSFADIYDGMLDGEWGGMSRRALEQALGCAPPCRLAASEVESFLSDAGERLAASGWQVTYLPALAGSLLVPGGSATGRAIGPGFTQIHASPDVTIYAARGPVEVAEAVGDDIRRNARPDRNSYFPAPKPRLRVWTAYAPFHALFGDGDFRLGVFYLRSDFRDGAWSSVLVAAPAERINVLRTVANSISAGRGEPLLYPEPPTLAPAPDPAFHTTEGPDDPRLMDAEQGNTDDYTRVVPSDVPDPEPASAGAPLLAEVERILTPLPLPGP
ncbi:hypothetical protein LV780_18595 [Cereibacter azotoformans]|uniref:Uncharacterized protein n=1 Tax=Cereibacter azotoformans TaxID=43057 RepID=A0A2T5JSC0_9RHOB|nr:hypothetical protein [Cereibacter azotoformans]PTR11122.1 hypothetical protein C8J28_12915 [Cereibacter azotoformans]UIJ32324.1 hypothetical protein LV780_18595 [Cereibacter azotoformans]